MPVWRARGSTFPCWPKLDAEMLETGDGCGEEGRVRRRGGGRQPSVAGETRAQRWPIPEAEARERGGERRHGK